ncbi:MAG: carbonic anhydrase family protein [Rhodoferax sp.]|uniref:carbonic anhydrase n=1 Tax=Rhodoferax sp. TaxID=50421 RepID=UPI00301A6851
MNSNRLNPLLATSLALFLTAGLPLASMAADHAAPAEAPAADAHAAPAKKPASSASAAKAMGDQVREAVEAGGTANKRITLVVNGKEKKFITMPAKPPAAAAEAPAAAPAKAGEHATEHAPTAAPKHAAVAVNPKASRAYIRAKAAAMTGHESPAAVDAAAAHHDGEVHWAYEGANGPQAWGQLKPEFNACAIGKRQSPINIEESATLQGPAEPLQFNYMPSSGSVVNNGHTIQVDLYGDNAITVRGSTYKLLQFHFHTPSEEQINYRNFAMVAHLVHKNPEGQLAVVAVLLDPGTTNALINKVWTYMPLDTNDRVRMPVGIIDMNDLLPKDQRYYQFMGSLTTPPCTEGVLWMVLKQPTTVSKEQIKLFSQLFPRNARPVQPVNGRAVRDAQ